MTVYLHLGHALRIIRTEPDFNKWAPLIDALTPEEQAEVRPWLRERVRIAKARASRVSVMPRSEPFSKSGKRC